jgi:type IV secretory pathway VirB4 component
MDYESLDHSEQEYAVKRLEAALTAFGPGFHVYQYLFKSNRPDIPFTKNDDPIVEAAIDQRRKVFEAKRDHLYQVEVFYCILLEGTRSKTGAGTALARLLRDPEGAIAELKSQFTNDNIKTLLRTHIERDRQRLDQHVRAFTRQLADFMQIEVLDQQGQFTFFRCLLNYDDRLIASKLQSTQFLDYQVVNSDIEAERDYLRVGDYIGRALTMKEAITETRPLVLDALLKIPANFHVVTEWTPFPADKARKEVNKRRRHFNMSKTGFVSQMGNDATKTNPRDVLVDESKQADIEDLGRLPSCPGRRAITWRFLAHDCAVWPGVIGSLKNGTRSTRGRVHRRLHQCGRQSVCRDLQPAQRLFRHPSGQLCDQRPQAVSAEHELRRPSFLFTILPSKKTNAHLGTDYLTALETDNSTPYFLNLHNG